MSHIKRRSKRRSMRMFREEEAQKQDLPTWFGC
jgi:hypothetical protein